MFVRVEERQEAELDAAGQRVAAGVPERPKRVERSDQHEAIASGLEAHHLSVTITCREIHEALVCRTLPHSEIGV